MTTNHESKSAATDAREAAVRDDGEILLRVVGLLPAGEFEGFLLKVGRQLKLRGWVKPESSGALVRALGTEDQLLKLVRAIRCDAPPSARVRSLELEALTPETPGLSVGFEPLLEAATEGTAHDGNHGPVAKVA